jgi:hypothetical protein
MQLDAKHLLALERYTQLAAPRASQCTAGSKLAARHHMSYTFYNVLYTQFQRNFEAGWLHSFRSMEKATFIFGK